MQVGGKLESNEAPEIAIQREILEKSRVNLRSNSLSGALKRLLQMSLIIC